MRRPRGGERWGRFGGRRRAAALWGLGWLLFLGGCAPQDSGGGLPQRGDVPEEEFGAFRLTASKQETLMWTLEAESAAVFEKRGRVEAYGVRMEFLDPEGGRQSELTADRGSFDKATRNGIARGNVVVRGRGGAWLETEELNWVSAEELFVTDSLVIFHSGSDVVSGRALRADAGLERVELREQVRGVFEKPDEP